MYACSGCGAALKFDIESQMLKCEFCGFSIEPEAAEDGKHDAKEMETNIFSCTQCGGEIYTMDNDITAVCSYCGSNMPLSKRIETIAMPKRIIPFKKTKENCKEEYVKQASLATFAPGEYNDEKAIDGFRGIYMPYWIMDVVYDTDYNIKGEKEYTSGDYRITEKYDLDGHVNAAYKEYHKDASIAFSDRISNNLEPFYMNEDVKPFNAAYMCGFYGEMQDVDASEATADAKADTFEDVKIELGKKYSDLTLDFGKGFEANEVAPQIGLLPIWFMSYNKNGRVSYAAINGQTGKPVMDIPIDKKKYIIRSLLFAPIFAIICNLLPITPEFFLAVMSLLLGCIVAYFTYDVSRLAPSLIDMIALIPNTLTQTQKSDLIAKQKKIERKKVRSGKITFETMRIWFLATFAIISFGGMNFVFAEVMVGKSSFIAIAIGFVSILVSLISSIICIGKVKIARAMNMKISNKYLASILLSVIAFVIIVIHPASDLAYFGVALLPILLSSMLIIELIDNFNYKASITPPQFEHKGGDDNA